MSNWNEGAVQLLRTLWADGLSATEISRKLKDTGLVVSRNSVIGKVHRLGLAGRATPSRPAKRPVRAARPRQTPRKLLRVVADEPPPIIPDLAPLVLENGKPAGVFDLTDSMCKFPIGDPSEADFAFCGRESSHGPYCKDHARLAYQPSGEGEKRRKAA